MSGSSDSALVKPFQSVLRFIGTFVDAVCYFFDSLIHPSSTYVRGRAVTNGNNSSGGYSTGPRSGPRGGGSGGGGLGSNSNVHTLRSTAPRGAPNMSFGSCRSCM